MVFSTFLFISIFLPLSVLGYFSIPTQWRNNWLLACSGAFYFWGSPTFFGVLIVTLVLDFVLVKKAVQSQSNTPIVISIITSVGLLFYYKYTGFVFESLNHIFPIPDPILAKSDSILLPIGVSFVTFQKISYAIDVRRKVTPPAQTLSHYLLYILFFPQLIAGPIVRYKDIAFQIVHRNTQWSSIRLYVGVNQFVLGLAKKVLIANTLSEGLNGLNLASLSSEGAMIYAVTYTMQLYFDFSGYSDMAIGLARIFGFKIPENFSWPFISRSITEFWKRWHMTLGNWMLDYLYIPLGGNKGFKWATYKNLVVVFLLSGLWHGASWNFVIWGAFHGFFLVIERLFLGRLLQQVPRFFSTLYVFILVVWGFVIFDLTHLSDVVVFHQQIVSGFSYSLPEWASAKHLMVLGMAIGCSIGGIWIETKVKNWQCIAVKSRWMHLQFWLMTILLILSLSQLSASDFNPFIYFRF